ncbi:bacillithiol system redox-active protein YtxJ [Bacillus lacus]|uniref:Bacillithiol system redox-active protein YtxJ n=1 Tax=Metabacillus lacus TaxID=1983721 RepID=A0A7X2LXM5_9BACI|nr:bacillithiol system redox-active protein YtxJ [Metabacillus lacus]MRX72725.1 bacillithiol system redox-active protein YtxJ [Metabacillus lacus]
MALGKIQDSNEFNELFSKHDMFLFLKNSTTCPISHGAFTEYKRFADEHDEVPTYYLNVQDSRELSNKISEEFGIKHESPQALLFKSKEVLWHDSHHSITYNTLTEQLRTK